jgi:WD40 repeat protein
MLKILKGHQDNITDIRFTNDSERIITASEDKTVKIWDLNGRLLRTLEGHTDKVNTMDISPDGTMLLTGSSDYSVRLWKLK